MWKRAASPGLAFGAKSLFASPCVRPALKRGVGTKLYATETHGHGHGHAANTQAQTSAHGNQGFTPFPVQPLRPGRVLFGAAVVGGMLYYIYNQYQAGQIQLTSLDPNKFVPFKLQEVIPVTHDSKIFRFALPTSHHELGLPVASCLVTKTDGSDGKPVVRPYTPISTEHQKGHFDLLVKMYETGNMSKHIHSLKVGDQLEVKGPIPKLPYTPNMKKQIGMLAGGTGITPMYQVLQKILDNPKDNTEVTLVFCNKTKDDILLKQELDSLAAKHPNRFKVHYLIDTPPKDGSQWTGGVGFINQEVVKQTMPPPSPDSLVLVCGPPGFYDALSGRKTPNYEQGELTGILKEIGYTSWGVYKF